MTVTVIGYMSIIVLFYAVISKKINTLLFAAIFFSGFSGSSVLYFESIGFSLQPSFFFFLCYFLLAYFNRKINVNIGVPFILFFAFCFLNSFFPLFLKDKVILMTQDGDYEPLRYSVSNIAHILYLLLDLVFLNTLIANLQSKDMYKGCIKAYRLGLWAVAMVCLYQIVAFKFGLAFDSIFRQDYFHGNVQGFRIYGPCGEASMLCYYTVTGIMFLIIEKKNFADILLIAILFILGIYTKSSTFLVGIALIAVYLLCRFIRNFFKKRNSASFYLLFFGYLIVIIIIATNSSIHNAVGQLVLKLRRANVSGQERFESFFNMLGIGLNYPLGVGFGSARSKDLFSTWMCNIGIFGVLLFAICILDIMLKANAAHSLKKTLPMLILVVLMMTSVPEPYNFFVWFLMAYPQIKPKQKEERPVLIKIAQVKSAV